MKYDLPRRVSWTTGLALISSCRFPSATSSFTFTGIKFRLRLSDGVTHLDFAGTDCIVCVCFDIVVDLMS